MDNKRGCPPWPGRSIPSEIAAVSFNLAFHDAQVSDRRCYSFRLHPAAFPFLFRVAPLQMKKLNIQANRKWMSLSRLEKN
jgi:hypothetical protein